MEFIRQFPLIAICCVMVGVLAISLLIALPLLLVSLVTIGSTVGAQLGQTNNSGSSKDLSGTNYGYGKTTKSESHED